MKGKKWFVLGGALAALLLAAAVGTQAVYADSATPPAPPFGPRGDRPPGPRGLGPNGLEAAAGVLGMTSDDLSAALQSGTTLQDLATQKGVDIQAVHDAMRTAHEASMLENIKQAVADGRMSQDKADWLTLGIEKGYTGGPGFGTGHGMGPGGPRGGPGQVPPATQ